MIPERVKRESLLRGKHYNDLVELIKKACRVVVSGNNVSYKHRLQTGTHIALSMNSGSNGSAMYIAQVDSNATGGGYYNCHLQTLDATDWDSTAAGQTSDTGSSVVVLNLHEIPVTGDTSSHQLSSDDYIMCWKFTDDEGATRYVGMDCMRYTDCS